MNKHKKLALAAGLAVGMVLPAAAMAQVMPEEEEPEYGMTPMGVSINVGGSVIGFTDENTRDFADIGGAWEARAVVGTRSMLAFEAAYVGSAHDINALGLDEDAVLLGSSLEAAARLNVTSGLIADNVQPYIFAGIGWTRYDLVNADFNTSSVSDNENLGYVPLGVGIGYRYERFMVDGRVTLRATFEDDLIDATVADEEAPLNTWSVGAKVGWEI